MRHFILIFVSICIFSVNSFCKITEFDKQFMTNPAKGIQDAVILEEVGVIDHAFTTNLSKIKYNVKMKFFTKKAIEDYGTIKLSYNPPNENIGDIKGSIYLPSGKTVKLTKKDIHKKKTSKEWGLKEVEVSIILPSLTEGAIVEYSYYKSFKGLESITRWSFQGDLYTVKSKVTFLAWPNYRSGLSVANQIATPVFKQGKKGGIPYFELTRTDIPPLKKEKYSLPVNAKRESVVFYYFDTDMKYKNYWIQQGNFLYKSVLKKRMKPCKAAKKIVANNNLVTGNTEESIKNIFNYVLNNYTSFSTLSKKQKAEITDSYIRKVVKANTPSKMLKLKYLYKYQMNYILGSLIQSAIPAATVEYCYYIPFTKSLFNPNVKTFEQFTDELLKVTVNGKEYWLSPIKRFLPPNQFATGTRGIQVFVLGEDGAHTEKIPTETFDKAVTTVTKEVFIEEDSIRVKKTITLDKHKSYKKRALMSYFNEDELKDLFEKEATNKYGEDAELVSYNIQNLKDIYKPLTITTEITYPFELDDTEKIFLPLIAIDKYKKNPFNASTRKLEIVFAYPNRTIQNVKYHLPEGFKLSSVPKNQSINSRDFTCNLTFSKENDSTLNVKTVETLERNFYSKTAFRFFKNSFDKIIKAYNTSIVIEEVEWKKQ